MSLTAGDYRELEEIQVELIATDGGRSILRYVHLPEVGARTSFAPELLASAAAVHWNGSDIVLLVTPPAVRYRVECYAPEIRGFIARRVA